MNSGIPLGLPHVEPINGKLSGVLDADAQSVRCATSAP